MVDDNEITLEVEKLMLESCGIEVQTASSGTQAVEMAGENDYSIIFMDIHMPEMDGYTAAGLIRSNDNDVKIIALSADEIPESEDSFVRSGMNGSIRKPMQLSDIKELLGRYLVVKRDSEAADSAEMIFSYDDLYAVMMDEKAIYRLVNQFLTVHGRDCGKLEKYLKNGNFTGAREILHNIIGISGNMFCKRLYAVSCRLSAEVKRDCYDSLDEFTEVWELTFAELTDCWKRLSGSEHENIIQDWGKLRNEFMSLCGDYDVAAVDLFDENVRTFMANMSADSFKKLRSAIEKYDFMWICDNMEVLNV